MELATTPAGTEPTEPSNVAATTTTVPAATALVAAGCAGQLVTSSIGALESDLMTEISGLAASRNQPGVVWALNDSGHAPQLFAITPDGALLASFVLEGITAIDWEDLALGPGPDPTLDYLYIADTGALLGNREEFALLRVAEPSVDPDHEVRIDEPLTDVESFPLRYPDRGPTTRYCSSTRYREKSCSCTSRGRTPARLSSSRSLSTRRARSPRSSR